MKMLKRSKGVIVAILILVCSMMVTSCKSQGVTSVDEPIEDPIESITYADGEYKVNVTMEGGTGKAYIESPAAAVAKDGMLEITLVWSSKNYDYMIVNDKKIMNENPGGNSTFTITVDDISGPLEVIGDTVAMSTPHEIEYVLYFEFAI